MSGIAVVCSFLVAVFVAVVFVFFYCRWLKKNTQSQNNMSVYVQNQGRPISGGVQHFKIVNR